MTEELKLIPETEKTVDLIKQRDELTVLKKQIKIKKNDPKKDELSQKRKDLTKQISELNKKIKQIHKDSPVDAKELEQYLNLAKSINHDTKILESKELNLEQFDAEKTIIMSKIENFYTQASKASVTGLCMIYGALEQFSYLKGLKETTEQNKAILEDSFKKAMIYNVQQGTDISKVINPNIALIFAMTMPVIGTLAINYTEKKTKIVQSTVNVVKPIEISKPK